MQETFRDEARVQIRHFLLFLREVSKQESNENCCIRLDSVPITLEIFNTCHDIMVKPLRIVINLSCEVYVKRRLPKLVINHSKIRGSQVTWLRPNFGITAPQQLNGTVVLNSSGQFCKPERIKGRLEVDKPPSPRRHHH